MTNLGRGIERCKELDVDAQVRNQTGLAGSPDAPLQAAGVAAPRRAADSERSRTCARLIALVRHLVRAVGGDGLVPGIAHCLLAALCLVALLNGFRGGDALVGPVLASVFILLYTLVMRDWREAVITVFAPDRLLSDPELGLGGRVALTVCRLVGAGIFWSFLTVGFMPAGGLLAMVPLGASTLQRLCTLAGLRWS
jgi:hypothetical protein